MTKTSIPDLKVSNPLPIIAEGAGVRLRKSGRSLIGCCPFHDDRNPSFTIYLVDSGWRFKCFGGSCRLEGDVIDFLGYLRFGRGWDATNPEQFTRVLEELGANRQWDWPIYKSKDWESKSIQPFTYQEITPQIIRAWDLAMCLYQDILLQTPEALEYLYNRGLTDHSIRAYRIGFCPPDGSGIEALARLARIDLETLIKASLLREYVTNGGATNMYEYFWGRITIADIDYGRRTSYIIGRKLPTPEDPGQDRKYIGLGGYPKTVFNLQRIKQDREPVFVVEAPLDAISIDQIGFDAVALHGTNPSQHQKNALSRIKMPVFIKDNDPAGEAALEAWQSATPSPIRPFDIPSVIDGVQIKDPNDLLSKLKPGIGEKVFLKLAKKRGWKPR